MFYGLFLTCALVHAQLTPETQHVLAGFATDTLEYAFEIHRYNDDTVLKIYESSTVQHILNKHDIQSVEQICEWLSYNAGKWKSNKAVWASAETTIMLDCQQQKLKEQLTKAIEGIISKEMTAEDFLSLHKVSRALNISDYNIGEVVTKELLPKFKLETFTFNNSKPGLSIPALQLVSLCA